MPDKRKILSGIMRTADRLSSINDRINPLNQKVDKSKITDTGTESVKQINSGVKTGKKTVKTVKNTVKTTKRTVKAVKNAPKNIKRAAKVTVKVVKATVKVFQAAVKGLSKVISFLVSNPIVLLILIILLIIAYVVYACVVMMNGAAVGEASTKQAFSDAGGLEDLPKQFKDGLEKLNKCKEDKEKKYDEWIDKLYYEDNNDKRRYSDLVYLVRYDKEDKETEYQKSLASSGEKQILKDALDWACGADDIEILSIAYVLAEKESNNIGESAEYHINNVKFTDELINKVLEKVMNYYDSCIDERQRCPHENCYYRKDDNPAWFEADRVQNKLREARDHWNSDVIVYLNIMRYLPGAAQSSYYNDEIKWRAEKWERDWGFDSKYTFYADTENWGVKLFWKIDAEYGSWVDELNRTDRYIYTEDCENAHKCYSKGLEFYSKEEIITALGFNDTEKLWVEYTEAYLRSYSLEIDEDIKD